MPVESLLLPPARPDDAFRASIVSPRRPLLCCLPAGGEKSPLPARARLLLLLHGCSLTSKLRSSTTSVDRSCLHFHSGGGGFPSASSFHGSKFVTAAVPVTLSVDTQNHAFREGMTPSVDWASLFYVERRRHRRRVLVTFGRTRDRGFFRISPSEEEGSLSRSEECGGRSTSRKEV